MAKVLVTGCAGFIGMHVALKLLARGDTVIGLDNLNDYYDIFLKQSRLQQLNAHPGFTFFLGDIADQPLVMNLFASQNLQYIIHLAAQAGVRYSNENPHIYLHSNVLGLCNILEGCRQYPVEHLIIRNFNEVLIKS